MNTYTVENKDGSIIILRVKDGIDVYTEIDRWVSAKKDKVKTVNGQYAVVSVEEDDIPSDRYFRDAWDKYLQVDMTKAREIHMNRIRVQRDKRLVELDKRIYGDDYDGERNDLRNIPQTFDLSSAGTTEELKAMWPDDLDR